MYGYILLILPKLKTWELIKNENNAVRRDQKWKKEKKRMRTKLAHIEPRNQDHPNQGFELKTWSKHMKK